MTDVDAFDELEAIPPVGEYLPALPVYEEPLRVAEPRVIAELRAIEPAAKSHQAITPWWERFTPSTDEQGNLILDPVREYEHALSYTTLGDRMTQTGVTDKALNTLLRIMQDPDTAAGIKADIAKYFVNLAGKSEGLPSSIQVYIDV